MVVRVIEWVSGGLRSIAAEAALVALALVAVATATAVAAVKAATIKRLRSQAPA